MRKCANCGSELGDTNFCTKCGAKVPKDDYIVSVAEKRFCTNCGAELGNEPFCSNCGAKNDSAADIPQPIYRASARKSSKGALIAVVAVVLAALIGVGCFKFFGGKSYEKIVRTLIGYLTGDDFDTEDLLSLFIPPSELDEFADEKYDGDKEKMIDEAEDEMGIIDMKEYWDSLLDMLEEYGVSASDISYKITDVEDMDDDEIDDIEEAYEEVGLNPKIKEGKTLEVEISVELDGEEKSELLDVDVVKIGNSWYFSPDLF